MDSDVNNFLKALQDAIKNDPNQFDRAKTDSMYDAFRTEVNALLNDVYNEVKTNAEKEVHSLEFAAQKMKKWFENGYASENESHKYESIHNDISRTKKLIITQSYVDYVNTIKVTSGTKQIVDEIQDSIRNNLRTCQNQFESYSNKITNLPNRMNKIRANKIGDFLKYLFYSITCIIIFIVTLSYVGSDPPLPSFILSMGDFIASIIMLPIMLIMLAIFILGIPASIWYFFKAIYSFIEIYNSKEKNKLKKKEFEEYIKVLDNKIKIACVSLI